MSWKSPYKYHWLIRKSSFNNSILKELELIIGEAPVAHTPTCFTLYTPVHFSLLWVRHCSKNINLYCPPNNPMRRMLLSLLLPLYKRGNWSTERLSNLSTQLVIEQGFEESSFRVHPPSHYITLSLMNIRMMIIIEPLTLKKIKSY